MAFDNPDRPESLHTLHAARRAIDQVYAKLCQLSGEFNRLLNIPAPIYPIGRRNSYEQRCSLWPRTSNGGNNLAQYSSAILK